MKKVKLQTMACIICWSSLNALTGQSLKADYPYQITHFGSVTNFSIGNNFYHENSFEHYPIMYWKPGMRIPPVELSLQLKPPKNYDFQLYYKSLYVEEDEGIKPLLIEEGERKLSQYPSGNVEPNNSFEYYAPESDRISSQQSDNNSKKPVPRARVPLNQTKGGHALSTVLFISNIIGRIALDNYNPNYNHSQELKTGEKSKSGSSNVSRRRNSNYSTNNQRK